MTTMRILVADREPRVRYALSVLLQEQAGWTVEGCATNDKEVLDKVALIKPDVLILDWDILKHSGARLVDSIRCFSAELKIIVLSTDPEQRQEALALGANQFFCKIDPPSTLLQMIRSFD